jgi:IS5 family transposase
VLQALYGIRSERLLCEQLGYNMLFRWFVGLGMEDSAWDHSTYTQNRDRLIDHDAIKTLFGRVMQQAQEAKLLSSEHFSVDGTLIRAWASLKSFVPKDGPRRTTLAARTIRKWISRARNAATIRTPVPPTRIPGCSPSRRKPRLCHPSWAMC